MSFGSFLKGIASQATQGNYQNVLEACGRKLSEVASTFSSTKKVQDLSILQNIFICSLDVFEKFAKCFGWWIVSKISTSPTKTLIAVSSDFFRWRFLVPLK